MDPAQSCGAVPDPLKVLILSGPLAKPDRDALKSYIQTNLQLHYPYREAKVDLCPLPNHSLRSKLDDLTKLSTFVEKHDKHDTLRYDWVLPLFYLPPLTEPIYMDIEEEAVNIVQSIALEASKAAKHVLFTTIAQSITKPSIPSINELNEEIQKLGASDGSHLLNISTLLAHWNNPSHPQTYSLISAHITRHIVLNEHEWDKMENHSLYALSLQAHNVLPCETSTDGATDMTMAVTVMPHGKYRPYLAEKSAGFVKLQAKTKKVRVELDFRCAQNMAKDDGFNPLQGIKINNAAPTVGNSHSPSIVYQAFQKLNTALRVIPNIPITNLAPTNRVGYTPGFSKLKYPGINMFRPSRVVAASYVPSLTEGAEVARVRGEGMMMGDDGIRRPLTINGMWRLELKKNRPFQDVDNNPAPRPVVENPFRRLRGKIIGEVVEPRVKPSASKRTHSATVEDEDEVLVVESEPEPSKRTHSAAFSAAGEEDEDEVDIPIAQRRQRLRHDKVILGGDIITERPARVAERASRAGREREPQVKYVRGRKGGVKGQGSRRGWRKVK